MQEQNFERQVKQKMEELSLTPSEPVWRKVEEQIRKKRDRRRFFFWLPLTVLVITGGVWFLSGIKSNNTSTAIINKEQKGDTENTTSTFEKNIADKIEKTQSLIKKDEKEKAITNRNFQQQN